MDTSSEDHCRQFLEETLYETPWDTINATAGDQRRLTNGPLPDPDLAVYEALGIPRQDHNVVFPVRQDVDDLRRLVEGACVQGKPDHSINTEGDDDDLLDRVVAKNKMFLKNLRQWLVVPICLLYFGGYLMSAFTMQQFIYMKIQQEQYPNVTFNDSVPVCNVNESDPNYILQTEIQQKSAMWMLYLGLASGIPAIFSNLILGSYTDRFGRKYLFYLASAGSFVCQAINAIGIYVNFSLYAFFPSFLLDGLTGSGYVIVLVSFSYIADIAQAGKSRTFRITLIEFSIGLGSAAFSVLAGYLVQHISFFWAMIFAASIMVLILLLVALLPESYPKEKRATLSTTPCSNVLTSLTFFFGRSNVGKRWMFNALMLTFLLSRLINNDVETLYQLNNPFCWSPVQISWYMGSSSALLLVAAIIVKPLQKVMADESIAILGCVSAVASYTLEGLAQNTEMLYAANVAGFLAYYITPMTRGLMSKIAPADKQGAIFASMASIETLGSTVGSVVANIIYEKTVGFFKGFVFFVFVFYNTIGLVLMIIFKIGYRRQNDYRQLEE